MWRLTNATLRERIHSSTDVIKKSIRVQSSTTSTTKRCKHDVAFQLDYYMSPQFAGVASALVNNTYLEKGIDITFLPTCPVGKEQERVRMNQNDNPTAVTMGSVEQNIFIPTLASDPNLKTTAVAAMFNTSPLCIAAMPDTSDENNTPKMTIGAHEDTVQLMKRIFPDHDVFASPRSTKNQDLLSNQFGAIQAYTTTEVPALRRGLGVEPKVTKLEGLNGTKLGYSQVVFTADECLNGDQRDVVKEFCEATFQGWEYAIQHPEQAVEQVKEAKKILGLDDEKNDHWHPSDDFELEMLMLCNEFVKDTLVNGHYGVIDTSRFNDATDWLLENKNVDTNFGLDTTLWK
jgi:hypothetical protein